MSSHHRSDQTKNGKFEILDDTQDVMEKGCVDVANQSVVLILEY